MPSNATRPSFQPGFGAQVDFLSELTRTMSDSVRKLSELNLQFAQQLIQDSFDATARLLSCTNPFQLAATAAHASQPAIAHLRHYQQQLVHLLSGSQIDMSRKSAAFLPDASRYTRDMASSMAHAEGAGQSVHGPS
jgi:phasin family protein